jgi:tetratricopeptide (TPR) repeat protein
VITNWHDRKIAAGTEWNGEIDEHLNTAQVILLLISPSFMSSNYCYDLEVTRAMERHKAGEAIVIPVFLRPVMWKGAPFGELQGLPTDSKPVTNWSNRDKAFLDIAEGIRKAVETSSPDVLSVMETAAIAAPVSLPSIIFRPLLVDFVARRNPEGRDIVELLRDELVPEGNRVIVLWGGGGVGKTTLAIQAARELSEGFGQRIVWASPELRSDLTLSTLLDEIVTQLGRDDLRQLAPELKEKAVRELMAAAPTLVILDNFETIALVEQQPCANWLVQRALCSAIITTRQRIMGARNILIDAMTPEEAQEFLERLIQQSSDPQVFNAPERARIIQAAGANPLVMQWIVAQIELAQSLSDVLDDLAHGRGDAAQRVFDRSFKLPLLGDDGRAALLALSLFVPSASRGALAEVAGFGSDEERLNEAVKRLAALRLVGTTNGGKRLIIQGLTRELAKARLMEATHVDEYRQDRQRFVTHFMNYAEAHAQTTREDFDALEAEKDNTLSAMDAAFDLEDWAGVVQTRFALNEFLDLRGYWDEAIRSGQQALAAARYSQNESAVAVFAHNLAIMHQRRGELESARRLYNESLEINNGFGDQRGIASTLHQFGRLAQDQGEIEEARHLYNESLEIKKSIGNQSGIASTLHQLGRLAHDQGEMEEARRLYNESLEINNGFGNQSGIASTLHQLGRLAYDQGEIEEARRLYNESLEINNGFGNQSGIASTLHQLGRFAHDQGEIEEARHLYNESLEIKKSIGNQSGIASTLHQLGRLAQDQGEIEEAKWLYNESLEIKKSIGNQSGIASTLHQLGRLAHDQGEIEEAKRLYNESLEIEKRLGNQHGIAISLFALGRLAEVENNKVDASRLFREALGIFERLKSPNVEIARESLKRLETEAS